MRHQNWQCPKCNNREFETGVVSGTGGFLSKFFNIQTQKFTTITCTRCTYTEMYKGESSTIENIFDFFGN
ncbi:zinc ribbon domain-containing protein [Aliifodinibius salicampi]|uniref:Zinc ribbon domain-containing protein n=1 Tax=Fodinibius salicampi TaxID=1920655 RepID=A0ABT3PWB8_9BACT|nr:zinc ribbon domain-containing protein [Fodinibius salicampi]MCW9712154.1 zinc ribbon domain-containing protein [Fodinibius salicampi]